jgi:energy-coupling factor transporter ATP-binding protein EcfA2
MLLEFRVRNYRSIRDEQALNLVASSDKEMASTHLAPTGLKATPHALRSAVVYGPNASGKSTVLRALDYLRAVVAESATVIQPGQTYNVQPFRLDARNVEQATEFEITFLLGGVRHQYAFAMTAQRIVSESLLVYRSSKPTQLFSRRLTEADVYDFEFSTHLSGPRKLWQESTRPNALFLSMAAQLNSEQLSPVFQWIVRNIVFLPAGAAVLPDFTTAMLGTEQGRTSIREFLAAADISIADVQAVPRKGMQAQWVMSASGLQASQEEREFLIPVFEHSTPQGSAKFELQDESDGTQRLYGLMAPVLDCLRDGRVLVVDELDSSLHPLLVRRLIAMFQNTELNPRGAQLIFSTHDTSLLDHSLFRRDQIWFTEKDADQATRLYPLTDFSPRKQEAWERGYLAGRYGAVPFFADLPGLAKAEAH